MAPRGLGQPPPRPMNSHSLPRLGGWAALLALAVVIHAEPADLPPVPPLEQILAAPAYRAVKIAPDGKTYCVVALVRDVEVLTRIDLATGKATPLLRTKGRILNYWWKNSDLLLIFSEEKDNVGFQTFDLKASTSGKRFPGSELLSLLPEDPDQVLVGRFSNYDLDPIKFNLRTGHPTPQPAMSNRVHQWIVDAHGNLVCGFGRFQERWFMQFPSAGRWRRVELGERSLPNFRPVFVAQDNRRIVGFDNTAGDTARVVIWDPANDEKEILHANESIDPDFLATHNDDWTRMQSISYETDRPRSRFVDASDQAIAERLARALPGTSVRIASASLDKTKMIVIAESEQTGDAFYLYDGANRSLSPLGVAHPALAPNGLVASRYLEFPARDGLGLHARVYLPPGRANPPAVVFTVWDGRARFGFAPEFQALATRGFAVAEIDCRGTSGYGEKFRAAGSLEISGKMVDDIVDGLDFLGAQGLIDLRRVAIMGRDLGGVIAHQAAARYPERFAALVSFWTPADLTDYHYTGFITANLSEREIKERYGGEAAIRRYLDKVAPLDALARLKQPTFHYYPQLRGARDSVLAESSGKIKRAIVRLGPPHVFVDGPEIDSFNSFVANATNASAAEWTRVYTRLLSFLEQHVARQ